MKIKKKGKRKKVKLVSPSQGFLSTSEISTSIPERICALCDTVFKLTWKLPPLHTLSIADGWTTEHGSCLPVCSPFFRDLTLSMNRKQIITHGNAT